MYVDGKETKTHSALSEAYQKRCKKAFKILQSAILYTILKRHGKLQYLDRLIEIYLK